jgi:CBS domain-containing protein
MNANARLGSPRSGARIRRVRDQLHTPALIIEPSLTLWDAARLMSDNHIGALAVVAEGHREIGILTERDVLDSVGAGQDPRAELSVQHYTRDVLFAHPDWTLEQAAMTMVQAGFRHLLVLERDQITGMLSMRDIVRAWANETGKISGSVRDAMTRVVLTIGPTHTVGEAARLMSARKVGAALVRYAQQEDYGILTERDVLDSIGAGQDPRTELSVQHCTRDVVFVPPDWTLEHAAMTMIQAGFRHLVVLERDQITGLLSMRAIVRAWADSSSLDHEALASRVQREADLF